MPEVAKVIPHAAAVGKSHPGATPFEMPWRTIGEGAALVAVESPGLKGSCKGVEAWHHLESL